MKLKYLLKEAMKTEVKAAVIKVTQQDLEMIPTIGTWLDIAQYMQGYSWGCIY